MSHARKAKLKPEDSPEVASPPATDLDELLYEEWLAYPDRRAYIPRNQHASYANQSGWWCSGRVGLGAGMLPVPAFMAEPEEAVA